MLISHMEAQLAAALIASALEGCAPPPAPCKPPEAVHLMVDAQGQYIVSDEVAKLRDGVDRACKVRP
jgi:hypothetical protein